MSGAVGQGGRGSGMLFSITNVVPKRSACIYGPNSRECCGGVYQVCMVCSAGQSEHKAQLVTRNL